MAPERSLLQKVYQQANEEAGLRGHQTISLAHLFLALLSDNLDAKVGRVLNACGLSYQSFSDALDRRSADQPSPHSRTLSSTAGRFVDGEAARCLHRAEGVAVGLSSPDVQPVHILIAFLWDSMRTDALSAIEEIGGTRQCLMEEVAQLDIPTPSIPLPHLPRWSGFRKLDPDTYSERLSELKRLEIPYRIGYKEGQMMISLGEGWEHVSD